MENLEISYGHIDWESFEQYLRYNSGDGVPQCFNSSQKEHENFVRWAAKYHLTEKGEFVHWKTGKRVLMKGDWERVYRRAHVISETEHRCGRETQQPISENYFLLGISELIAENRRNCYVCRQQQKLQSSSYF